MTDTSTTETATPTNAHRLAGLIRELVSAITDPGAPYSLIDEILGEVRAKYGAELVSVAAGEAERQVEGFRWAARRWDGQIHPVESEGTARLLVRSANGEPSKRHWYTAVLHRDGPDCEWSEVEFDA